MLIDGVPEPACHAVDRALEPRVAERLDLAAVAADEMMVVVAVGRRGLVARDPVTGVDALHQPQLDESLECPVHRSDPDGTPRPP